jgi:nucleoside-diphosphate-sugar epimerase
MGLIGANPHLAPVAAVRTPDRWSGPGRAVAYDLLDEALPDLTGVDVVIHCAARVHVMADAALNPLEAYRAANTLATARLAAHAAASGVRRFIFVSTIKVNGETTLGRGPFTATDAPSPQDPYGQSKLEAEQALIALAEYSSMEVSIIRPPLVYGPGVKANFRTLMRALDRGLPLPCGALHNRRSMISVQNLADLIVHCIDAPGAAGITLARDQEQPTTSELMSELARALGRPPRLLPVPAAWLRTAGKLMGRGAWVSRLCDPLEVDLAQAAIRLGWQPPVSLKEGLRLTAQAYHKERK